MDRGLAARGAATGRRATSAELAASRLFAVGGGVFALLSIALGLVLSNFRQEPITLEGPLPWFFADLVGIAAVGAAAPWLGLTALRIASGTCAAAFGLVVAGAALHALRAPYDTSLVPWAAATFGAPLLAAVVAIGLPGVWAIIAVSLVGTQLMREVSQQRGAGFWANDAQSLMTGLVLGFIGAVVLDLSRRIDTAAAERASAAESASRERGRLTARARAAALVHDEVLAALNLAASPLPLPPERIAEQAVRARTMLAELTPGEHAPPESAPASGTVTAEQLVARLEHEARDLSPAAAVSVRREPGWELLRLPQEAAEALSTAARQALSNSASHAGAEARPAVAIHLGAAEANVRVSDRGAGFDPALVPPHRLGVRVSIEQRMRDAGGLARVTSAPGAGTEVRLAWPATAAAAPGETAHEAAHEPNERLMRAGLAIIAVAFCVTQFVAAWSVAAAAATSVATSAAGSGAAASGTAEAASNTIPLALGSTAVWMPFVVLAIVFAGAEVLRRARDPRPNDRRVAPLIAVLTAASIAGAATAPFGFAEMWFAVSVALVYAALAFRGRGGAALVGGGLLVAVLVAAGIAQAAAPLTILVAAARPIIVVGISVGLAAAVQRMQQRAESLHARAVADVEQRAWWAGRRSELAARGAQVRSLVDPTLAMLASSAPMTPQLRRQCLALEGQLRDEVRAGRLAAEPLASAAARARSRGVDVVLLDDREGPLGPVVAEPGAGAAAPAGTGAGAGFTGPTEPDFEVLLERMAAALDLAQFQAVGRMLPAGRARTVSLIVDGRSVDLTDATPQNH